MYMYIPLDYNPDCLMKTCWLLSYMYMHMYMWVISYTMGDSISVAFLFLVYMYALKPIAMAQYHTL